MTLSLLGGEQQGAPEAAALLFCFAGLLVALRRPRLGGVMGLTVIWAELMFSIFEDSEGIRASASVAVPMIIIGTALLLGSRLAWLHALMSAIAAPAAALLGHHYLDGPGIPERDLTYVIILELSILGTALLLGAFLGTLRDVIEQEGAHARRVEDLLEEAPDAIIAVDGSGTIILFNQLAETFLGVPRREAIGTPITEIDQWPWQRTSFDLGKIEASNVGQAPNLTPRAQQTRPGSGAPLAQEVNIGGRTVEVRIRRTRMSEGERQGEWLFVLRDISQRRAAEARAQELTSQLEHSQRMEAIGQLAGGVAHDFNNLLTAVGGSAYVLTKAEDPLTREIAKELASASERGAALTRQLLTFARRDLVQSKTIDLKESLFGARPLLLRLLGERIELSIDAEDGCTIVTDEGQLEQVLLNLAANARDALDGNGRFVLLCRRVEDRVFLEARDNGRGMDPAVKKRIFEPFFSTKDRTKGTGLGLSTVHGIVERWDGTIDVTSSPGEGTSFIIDFPFSFRPRAHKRPSHPEPEMVTQEGTILLAEDDPHARVFVERLLKRSGFTVLTATSAEEALALYDGGARPDLVVSDVIMSGKTGVDLAEHLRAIEPGLPVLFISGYVDDVLQGWPFDTTSDLLLKPFAPEQLLSRIQEKLAGRKRG